MGRRAHARRRRLLERAARRARCTRRFRAPATIAEQLDASSLRFALHHIAAEQLAVELKLREAIARLEQAMGLADRASPMMLMAFANLASYCQICGEPAAFERVTSFLAGSPRTGEP